ncbi:hypothetical protein vseg_000864 [Gypsophila vaccaria]
MEGGEQGFISAVDSSSPPISAADDVVVLDSSPPSDDHDSLPLSAASSEIDLRPKIIKQVEYYFSDENLPNDKFLMKYVKKDKEGFVPISVIATFRKMKRLTKDSSVIVDALKDSSLLVVSSDGKKVKRLHPLPSSETNCPKSCAIVVENLPDDHSTENIQRIFGQVGSVKSISIHDPQVNGDTNGIKTEKLLSGKLHALIEYETEEAAEKAGPGLGRKTRKGLDSKKGGDDQVPVSDKDGEKDNDAHDDEEADHVSKEKFSRKGRNRSKGQKHRGNIGMGHGTASVVEPSKPPPGPRMPDGTRGFTMGRGRPLIFGYV